MLVALAAAALISPSNLDKLVLKPAAVGVGYVLVQRTDGQGTAQRTLDLLQGGAGAVSPPPSTKSAITDK